MVAGYQVLKDHYTQWGQQVEQVAPKDAPNTKGQDPLGAWAISAPPPRLQLSKRACTSDPPPMPRVMPFVGFVAQASHWFWLGMRLSTLRVVSLGEECNRPVWATRTGLRALARLRLWRVAMVIARVAEIEICSESVDFDDCLVGFLIFRYRLQRLMVVAVTFHS